MIEGGYRAVCVAFGKLPVTCFLAGGLHITDKSSYFGIVN